MRARLRGTHLHACDSRIAETPNREREDRNIKGRRSIADEFGRERRGSIDHADQKRRKESEGDSTRSEGARRSSVDALIKSAFLESLENNDVGAGKNDDGGREDKRVDAIRSGKNGARKALPRQNGVGSAEAVACYTSSKPPREVSGEKSGKVRSKAPVEKKLKKSGRFAASATRGESSPSAGEIFEGGTKNSGEPSAGNKSTEKPGFNKEAVDGVITRKLTMATAPEA